MSQFHWLTNLKRNLASRRKRSRAVQRRALPIVSRMLMVAEALEDRALLSTITVTSLSNVDAVDGAVTLSEAIQAAETDASVDGSVAGSGADIINFAPSLFLGEDRTLTLTSFSPGDQLGEVGPTAFKIGSNITIVGPTGESGLILSIENNFRFFQVLSTGSLKLERLALVGGRAIGGNGGTGSLGGGGGAGLGGAIFNQGTLVVRDTYFAGNQAVGGDGGSTTGLGSDGGGGGGGLAANGANQSGGTGGNGGGPAGGQGSAVNGIAGADGGLGGGGGGAALAGFVGDGLYEAQGGFGGNGGPGGGGGGGETSGGNGGFGGGGGGGTIVGVGGFGAGNGSQTYGWGGGGAGMGGAIFNSEGSLTVINSTFTYNLAKGGAGNYAEPGSGYGGAIFSHNGSVAITSSTIANNSTDNGGVYILSDDSTASLNVTNSIFAYSVDQSGNPKKDLLTNRINGGTLTTGEFDSMIVQAGTLDGVDITDSLAQHIQVTDPLLNFGPFNFSNNGGAVPTIALASNSPAIDAGSFAPLSAFDLTQDARGYGPRVTGAAVDLGAYEYLAQPNYVAAFPFVRSSNGLGSSGIGDADFVVPAGVNRLLVATVIDNNDGSNVASVKLGGVDATLVANSADSGVRTSIYVMALGSNSADVSSFFEVNWTANTNGMYLTQFFMNVDQANPVGFITTNNTRTTSVVMGESDLAVSMIGAHGVFDPLVAGADQDLLNTAGYSDTQGAVSTKADDGNGNTFTYADPGGSATYAHTAFGLQFSSNVNPSAPRISSIVRQAPTNQRTSDDTVVFRVSFNEPVVNGDASDFRLIGPAAQGGKASFGNVMPVLDQDLNTVGYDVAVVLAPDSNGDLSLGIKGTSDIKDLEDNGFSGFVDASEGYYIDNAAPVLSVTTTAPAIRSFDFGLTSDEPCSVAYLLLPASASPPAPAAVQSNPTGTLTITDPLSNATTLTGLDPGTDYVIYYTGTDQFGFDSQLTGLAFTTASVETQISLDGTTLVITDINTTTNDDLSIGFSNGNFVVADSLAYLTTAIAGATGDESRHIEVPSTGIDSIRIELGNGSDQVIVATTPTTLGGGLTINGSSAATVSLASLIDAAGGDISITAGTVELLNSLKTNSTGTITVNATSVTANKAALTTESGAITLNANYTMTPVGGSFAPMELVDSSISTESGPITLRAISGDASGSVSHPTLLLNSTTISSSGAGEVVGAIQIDATSRQGADGPAARLVSGSSISSVDASISVTGSGSSSGGLVLIGATIQSTGGGMVTLAGHTDNGYGFSANKSKISTVSNQQSITGTSNLVAFSADATLFESDSGQISLTGLSSFLGIELLGTDISSKSGPVLVDGKGSGSIGFRATDVSSITTTTGSITLTIHDSFVGVDLDAASVSSTSGDITFECDDLNLNTQSSSVASSGRLLILPHAAGTSIGIGDGVGTLHLSSGEVGRLSNGFSAIVIGSPTGIGAGAIDIENVTLNDDLTITGSSIAVTGLDLGSGTVAMTATTGSIQRGTHTNDMVSDIAASIASLSAAQGIGDEDTWLLTALSTVAAQTDSGDIALFNEVPLTIGTVVTPGYGTTNTGVANLGMNQANSAHDLIFVYAAGGLQIDQSVESLAKGPVTLSTGTTASDNGLLTVNSDVSASGGKLGLYGHLISVDSKLSNTELGKIDVSSDHSLVLQTGSHVVTQYGDIKLSSNVDYQPNDGDFIGLEVVDAMIESGLGSISLSGVGGSDSTTSDGIGIRISNSTLRVTDLGSPGAISLSGTGRNTSANSTGIRIENNSTLQTVEGHVFLNGGSVAGAGVLVSSTSDITTNSSSVFTSKGAITIVGSSTDGIAVDLRGSLETNKSDIGLTGNSQGAKGISLSGTIYSPWGDVSLTGTSMVADGVFVAGSVDTVGGDITVQGTSRGADQGAGLLVIATSKIHSVGSQISLTGTGQGGTLDGLSIACDVTTDSGSILLTGSTENASGSGITVHRGKIGTSFTDIVRFTADTLNLLPDQPTDSVQILGDGWLSFVPLSADTPIGLNAAGTLVLDNNELGSIADGFSQISFGQQTDGTGLVIIDGATFTDNVSVYGGSLILNELNVGTNRVELFAQTGSITGLAGAVRDVVASEAALQAKTRIGDVTVGQPLLISVDKLASSSDSGSILLNNNRDLIVTSVGSSLSGMTIIDSADDDSGDDNIELSVMGLLTVESAIANDDLGLVLLKTLPSASDDITINKSLSGGVVRIESADDVTLGVVLSKTVGDVSITAGTDTDNGAITQTGGLVIDSDGELIIKADESLVVDRLTSPSRMTVTSSNGSIMTTDADETVDFTAGILGLEAATGIGAYGNNENNIIDVAAPHMAARTSSGDIHCVFTGSVNLDQAFGQSGFIYGVEITDLDNAADSGNDCIRLLGNSLINVDRLYNSDGGEILVSASNLSVSVPNVDEVSPIDLESVNGTILYGMSARANLNVTGLVTIGGGGFGAVTTTSSFASKVLVKNDGNDVIRGRLTGLPEGSTVTINGQTAYLTYLGGDGNDLALVTGGSTETVMGTAGDDQFEVRQVVVDDPESPTDFLQIQTLLGGAIVDLRPAVAGGSVAVLGLAGNDTLYLNDNASGGFIVASVAFDGGNDTDLLRTSAQSVDEYKVSSLSLPVRTLAITPVANGTISNASLFDVESLENNLTSNTATFELTNQADNVTLSNGGTLDMQLTSSKFSVDFKNPINTIEILALDGDDSVTLQSIHASFVGSIFVSGGDGADSINAAALAIHIRESGGAGNDTIVGSQGFDCVSGGDGNDSIVANGGNDLIFGGAGDDVISAGDGDDFISLGDGDGNDTIDGDNGVDRFSSFGSDSVIQGDRFTIADSAGRIAIHRLSDPGLNAFSGSVATVETFEVLTFSGNDSIDARNLTLIKLTIDAGSGDDVIYGGSLDDLLLGGSGADTVRGGAGNDVILGGADPDWLDGEAGDDRVRGQGASLDVLIGGLGTDTLDGGEGSDIVMEFGDQNYVLTNSQLVGSVTGTDSLVLVELADLSGGNSANSINASAFTGATTLSGGAGNDTISGGTTADVINADEGDDVVNGGDGNDRITGFGGNDLINAGKGNDIVRGSAGRDTINGGDGDDKLYGQGSSFDVLSGDAGNDTVSGGAGDDQLSGGDGDDFFVWEEGDGSDVMNGNAGTDRLRVYASKSLVSGDLITIRDNAGRIAFNRAANGAVSAFNLDMGLIERISIALFGGNDSVDASGLTLARLNIDGGFGNDTLIGGSQIDYLAGSVGNDSLVGGGGIDTLVGGLGADTCNGGAAVDVIDVSDSDAVDTVQNSALDQVMSNLNDLLL